MRRIIASSSLTLALALVAAGCGAGTSTHTTTENGAAPATEAVSRLEMADIEHDFSKVVNAECHEENVEPELDCVDKNADGSFTAHFGYENERHHPVTIKVGHFNRFRPKPEDRGQPTLFAPGKHPDVFTVNFDGKPLAWFLARHVAIASRNSKQCQTQPMCPPSCDDGNPCTTDSCSAATNFLCVHTPVTDGISCSDNNVCNGAETCKAGVCISGTPLSCDDNNPCTGDSCDPTKGCQHSNVPDGTSCPATSACFTAGMCEMGVCQPGQGKDCDDKNPCTADSCAPDGTCLHTPVVDGTSCSDGNACNGAETCKMGTCTAGTPLTCTNNNPCTTASCDPNSGCVFTPVADGTSCPSPTGCGSTGACTSGMCQPTSGPNCDDGNPCTADACGANGTCTHTIVSDGTSCSDGNACNGLELCQSGQCQPGTPVVCTAVDQCHLAGTCDPATGTCSKPVAPNGTTCSDGNACTSGDACQTGVCQPGKPTVCTASDACHSAGTCDPTSGNCSNPPVADGTSCSDGNACNGNETCKAGVCNPGTPLNCDDGNPCTAKSCDPVKGCQSTPVPDGTVCGAANGCQGASTCKAGVCTAGTNGSCDDANPCTADSCGANGTCVHTPVANGTSCSDGNLCNGNESCQAGVCAPGTPVACTASDQCHVAGTCNPATGQCSNPPAPDGTTCSDGNACTTGDACKAGACASGTPTVCTASDQCHVAGTCDPTSGKCSNPAAADGTSCSDGNACTTADACKAGACVSGNPVTCMAKDQCHAVGTCDPSSGQCSNPIAPDGTTCNDGNNCTQTDACKAGVCSGSNPVTCTAQDQCHVAGTCDPVAGTCSNPNAADGTACNDNNKCTQTDACQAGTCTGSNPVVCTAQDQCHLAGTCDPAAGTCSNPNAPDGTTCKSSNLCLSGTACLAGSCAGGSPLVCTADPGCTPGTCNPTTGVCSPETNCPSGCVKEVWAAQWASPILGNVTVDKAGAIYATGGIAGSIDFGTGPLTTNGSSDVYLVKVNSATGKATWAFNFGDTVDQAGVNLAADNNGHLVVIGTYTGTLAFGGSAPSLTAATDSIFIAGFDASTGGALWAKDISLGGGALLGIAGDPRDHNVVVTGFTGAGAAANFGGGALTSGGGKDVVAAKFNATTGALIWARQIGGAGDQLSNAVAVDGTSRVFLTGQYSGTLDFGSGALPVASSASKRIFVARLDANTGAGTGQVAKAFGTSGQQASVAIAVDSTGDVIVGGAITGATVDFGTGPLVSAGAQDAFVAKLSPDLVGVWAHRYGDNTIQKTQGLTVDGMGNVIAVGLFQGTLDTAPTALTSAGGFDAFALTLDAATGAVKCAAGAGDASDQGASGVAFDVTGGSEYVYGSFISSIAWDGATALTGTATESQTYLVQRK